MSFPTKDQRQKCWGAKDKYWECLESSSEHQEACAELRTVYETLCPAQWVRFLIYFLKIIFIQNFLKRN